MSVWDELQCARVIQLEEPSVDKSNKAKQSKKKKKSKPLASKQNGNIKYLQRILRSLYVKTFLGKNIYIFCLYITLSLQEHNVMYMTKPWCYFINLNIYLFSTYSITCVLRNKSAYNNDFCDTEDQNNGCWKCRSHHRNKLYFKIFWNRLEVTYIMIWWFDCVLMNATTPNF